MIQSKPPNQPCLFYSRFANSYPKDKSTVLQTSRQMCPNSGPCPKPLVHLRYDSKNAIFLIVSRGSFTSICVDSSLNTPQATSLSVPPSPLFPIALQAHIVSPHPASTRLSSSHAISSSSFKRTLPWRCSVSSILLHRREKHARF